MKGLLFIILCSTFFLTKLHAVNSANELERLQQRYLYLFNEQIDIKDRLNALNRSINSVLATRLNGEEFTYLESKIDSLQISIFTIENTLDKLSTELILVNQRLENELNITENRSSEFPFYIIVLSIFNLLFLIVNSVLFYRYIKKPSLSGLTDKPDKQKAKQGVKLPDISGSEVEAKPKDVFNGSNVQETAGKSFNLPNAANKEIQLELLYKEAEILVVKMKNESLNEEHKAKYEHLFNETYDKILNLKNM